MDAISHATERPRKQRLRAGNWMRDARLEHAKSWFCVFLGGFSPKHINMRAVVVVTVSLHAHTHKSIYFSTLSGVYGYTSSLALVSVKM